MYGSPYRQFAKRVMLLGAGELGKEVVIELQRLGVETIAVDRYPHAPAMQVAHHSFVIDMLDGDALRTLITQQKPHLIVPEIEAIATDVLLDLEKQGYRVIPTALATKLTMNREGIRRLAAEQLGLRTARYAFAESIEQLHSAVQEIGIPCVIKPIMSSSGKGQSVCRNSQEIESCWEKALEGGRARQTKVIVEQFIHFDSEITLLTVRSVSGTTFCSPIGHIQKDGDYIESWQPHAMSHAHLEEAHQIAKKITDALGGYGLFGVELFLTRDAVYFSEVSPRPHDTGMVTMVTQDLSEFALHARAILELPIPTVKLISPGASYTLKADCDHDTFQISGMERALAIPHTQIRIFGKPVTKHGRRMAVAMSQGDSVDEARHAAKQAAQALQIIY